MKEEKEDHMKLRTIEMPKVDLNKSLEDMNEQEKMIYYFLNCHKGMDDRWKKIIEDFQKLHENEERIELQLELEEAEKKSEEAEKKSEEAEKKVEEANKKVRQMVCKMHESGMSLEQISAYCSLNVDEIELLIKS